MNTNFRVVIASTPLVETDSPLMAPAVLKSCLTSANISSVALDLNAEFLELLARHEKKDQIEQFLLYETISEDVIDDVRELFDYLAQRILSYNPEWVALSLLTYLCQNATKWLCLLLKMHRPDIKIVIGGPGCFSTLKSIDSYATQLKSQKLIDDFVVGDGEIAIVKVIQADIYQGINSIQWREIENLDNLPIPDFDDYNWHLYKHRKISIWGSRGCVRDCTFCDIHEHWSKFTWRSAENIFEEIVSQYQKYKINQFHFADSLVNGNQKEYRKLIKLLAEFNQDKLEDDKIKWGGFFIFRQKEQMREEDWKLTADSGAQILAVGVESFVEHIRYHIRKKFDNQDLDYGLEMCKKYNIGILLLMISGYVTETHDDHQEQLNWLKNNAHFANSPVVNIEFGQGLSILPGTFLHRNAKELGVELVNDGVYVAWSNPSIQSTPEVRLQRLDEIKNYAQAQGFSVSKINNNHKIIHDYLTDKSK